MIATLGCEDSDSFTIAMNAVFDVVERLRRRNIDGKRVSEDDVEANARKRCCTRCGYPGHMRRTCTSRPGETNVAQGDFSASARGNSSMPPIKISQPVSPISQASKQTREELGRTPMETLPFLRQCAAPPLPQSRGGANIFLGGQHRGIGVFWCFFPFPRHYEFNSNRLHCTQVNVGVFIFLPEKFTWVLA
ncbi:hypothetical protein PIB30_063894 [Stylosanthes scabra]|uniref:CCHC-type domain-containing protein n=1 Tax=Stylosanthes scabra TaxID=79078 RepID=A0ABU6YLV5_9FABA|nr:hypothetical protein [Stylosanthes scabra]